MSSYWDSYGTTEFRGPRDICHYYGHWNYECNFSPYYSTPYNTQWEDPSFGQEYEDNQGAVYDQNFQEQDYNQYSQNQQGYNEHSMCEKLGEMISLLKNATQEIRQSTKENNEQFNQHISQFYTPIEEVEEDGDTLDSQAQNTKQTLVADDQNLEHEENSLYFPKHKPDPESFMPIYTEHDYVLDYDNIFEIDESKSLIQEHIEMDSTQENMDIVEGDVDEFDGVEMTEKETAEVNDNFQPVEKISIEATTELVNQKLFDLPLSQPVCASGEPTLMKHSEILKIWHQDTINPSRKGWDLSLDDGSWLYQKVYGNLIGEVSHGLVIWIWEFYHSPFKKNETSDWFKRSTFMERCKCGEETSKLLGFEDDRVDIPDIITWYKDRGRIFSPTS